MQQNPLRFGHRFQLGRPVSSGGALSSGRQCGAAALEYILVSTFAAVVAIAALGFVGKVVRDQLTAMAAKLGVTEVPEVPSPFPSGH